MAYFVRVSEQFLNGTSAQLGYTVPFTSVYAGKNVTEDKPKTDTTKTKHNRGLGLVYVGIKRRFYKIFTESLLAEAQNASAKLYHGNGPR